MITQDDAAGDSGSAEDIYGEFLQRRREGEDVDLEEYCEEHPRLAHALRALHSMNVNASTENPPAARCVVVPTTARWRARRPRRRPPAGVAPSASPIPCWRRHPPARASVGAVCVRPLKTSAPGQMTEKAGLPLC